MSDYTPPRVADKIDTVLEIFGAMLDDAQLLRLRVTWRYKSGASTDTHYFNPRQPMWQDQVAAILKQYGQNRIIGMTCDCIVNPKEAQFADTP